MKDHLKKFTFFKHPSFHSNELMLIMTLMNPLRVDEDKTLIKAGEAGPVRVLRCTLSIYLLLID